VPDRVEFAVRRVVVALDASAGSLDAAAAAVVLARLLGAELRGLFVEDEDLLRLAALPFAQVARTPGGVFERLRPEDAIAQLRALAARARESLEGLAADVGLSATFQVARGRPSAEVPAAAGDRDLLVVGAGGHTRSGRTAPGETARAAAARARGSVLVLARGARVGEPVVAVHDGSAASARGVAAAARLARGAPAAVLVVAAAPGRQAALAEEARRIAGPAARVRPAPPGVAAVVSALAELRPALVVVPAEGGALGGEAVEHLLALGAPVLVVR
jgi:nucleotide-binding universal stress UspA family protein